MSGGMDVITPAILRLKTATWNVIGPEEVNKLENSVNVPPENVSKELVTYIFDRIGRFYIDKTKLTHERVRDDVRSRQDQVLKTYQALVCGDELVKSGNGYTIILQEERRRLTYECLSHLQMPVQQLTEILAIQPRAIDPHVAKKIDEEFEDALHELFKLLDEYQTDHPVEETILKVERFAFSTAGSARRAPKAGTISFSNWHQLILQWHSQQPQKSQASPFRAYRIGLISTLSKLIEEEPLSVIAHEEIDPFLQKTELPFKSYFIWSAIKEIGHNIGFTLQGPILLLLYNKIDESPRLALDLMYFTCFLDRAPIEKLKISSSCRRWLNAFKKHRAILKHLPQDHGIDLQQLLLWLVEGKEIFIEEEMLQQIKQNGSLAFKETQKITAAFNLLSKDCFELFVTFLSPEARAKIETHNKLFNERMKDVDISDFQRKGSLLQLFFSGAVAAFEDSFQITIPAQLLLNTVSISSPLTSEHIKFCLKILHDCNRYQWSLEQKLSLFLNFLSLQESSALIQLNYQELQWMETFSSKIVSSIQAYHWMTYHPDPNVIPVVIYQLEMLKERCVEEYVQMSESPHLYQEYFAQYEKKFSNIPSALPELTKYEGFPFIHKMLSEQVSYIVFTASSQWWTRLFTGELITPKKSILGRIFSFIRTPEQPPTPSLFGWLGFFYDISKNEQLPPFVHKNIELDRKKIRDTLDPKTMDKELQDILKSKGAYGTDPVQAKEERIYTCISHLPMPLQRASTIKATEPHTLISNAHIEQFSSQLDIALSLIFKFIDDDTYEPSPLDIFFLEKFIYSKAALASKDAKSNTISFTNWSEFFREYAARHIQGAERIRLVSPLAKRIKDLPRTAIPHAEIDKFLEVPEISFRDFFIWSAIKEIGKNSDFEFSGPAAQMLHKDLAGKPHVALDLLYYTCLPIIDLSKIKIDPTSKRWLTILIKHRFIRSWGGQEVINHQKMLLWLAKGVEHFSGHHIADNLSKNGALAFKTTEKILDHFQLPAEFGMEIFVILLPHSTGEHALPALKSVEKLIKLKKIGVPDIKFWIKICRELAPWTNVQVQEELFIQRLDGMDVPKLETMELLLQLFLSGAILAFEKSQGQVIPQNLLKELFTDYSLPISFPLNPEHIAFCLNYLKACDRYEWDPVQKISIFLNFLALQSMPDLIRENFEQLCWIEKFSSCPLRGSHAYNWLIYHPQPTTIWEAFNKLGVLRQICDQKYLKVVTIPDEFEKEFRNCRLTLATVPSVFSQLNEFDGFKLSIDSIRMQIAFTIFPVISEWWTKFFQYKHLVDDISGKYKLPLDNFTGEIMEFGGSLKYVCCNWFRPGNDDSKPIFEIRIITNFATRTIRKRFVDNFTQESLGKTIQKHAQFFGEETPESSDTPPEIYPKFRNFFEALRIEVRQAWKTPTAPFLDSFVKQDTKDQLASAGNVYPIKKGLSLLPSAYLLTPADFERYAIQGEYDPLIAQIIQLVRSEEAKKFSHDPFVISYNPQLVQQDYDKDPFKLHELTISHGSNKQMHRYFRIVNDKNLSDWIRWHLLQLKARTFRDDEPISVF
jgi:hypothetical protein